MKNRITYICFICLSLLSFKAYAQNTTQLWLDYYQYRMLAHNKWKMSNRYSLHYFPDEDYNFRVAYRPDFAHKVRQHGRFVAGSGFFYRLDKTDASSLEVRPWIGFQRDPAHLNSVSLTHYVRWENRIFFASDSEFESRFRYKITGQADVFRREGRAMSMILEPEIFFSVGAFDNFYSSQFRVTAGTRIQWNTNWRTDFSVTRKTTLGSQSNPTIIDEDYDWYLQLKVRRLLFKN